MTRKATGLTLYYTMHEVKLLLPFDITKATFFMIAISTFFPTANFLAVWTHML